MLDSDNNHATGGEQEPAARAFEGCTQSTEPASKSAPPLLADLLGQKDLVRVVTLGPRVGTSAHQARFEELFLDTLKGR